MPPVVVAAGITAAGALAGSALASRATNKATSTQAKANEDTLAYTKEKEAQTRADAMYREGLWQKQYNDWNNQRNALLQRYGFSGSFSPLSGYGQTPMGSAGGGQAVPRAAAGRPAPSQSPYADMVPVAPEENADGYTNTAWNDWRRYGLEE